MLVGRYVGRPLWDDDNPALTHREKERIKEKNIFSVTSPLSLSLFLWRNPHKVVCGVNRAPAARIV